MMLLPLILILKEGEGGEGEMMLLPLILILKEGGGASPSCTL